jgi:pilus assembly protein Flp/PilA
LLSAIGHNRDVDQDRKEGGVDAIRAVFRRLRSDKRGATAVEYGLIAALIVVAMTAGLSALGGGANGMWAMIAQRVVDAG